MTERNLTSVKNNTQAYPDLDLNKVTQEDRDFFFKANKPFNLQIQAFYNNKAIKHLMQFPAWTVTNGKKLPLNISKYIDSNFKNEALFSYNTKDESLLRLGQFCHIDKFKYQGFAFRNDVNQTHYLILDIERNSGTAPIKLIASLPIAYWELSKHNGSHVLVEVPDEILHSKKYENLFNGKSVIKIGSNGEHSGVEVIFRKHFITFTKKVMDRKKIINEELHSPYAYYKPNLTTQEKEQFNQNLQKFLDVLEKASAYGSYGNNQVDIEGLQTNDHSNAFNPALVTHDAKVLANQFTNRQLKELKALTPADYGDDHSRYQFNVLIKAYGCLQSNYKNGFAWSKNPFTLECLHHLDYTADNQPVIPKKTIILMLYSLALDMFEHRKKDNHFSNGMPFFMYQATKVVEGVRDNDRGKLRFKVYRHN